MTEPEPLYQRLSNALWRAEAELGAAECHGVLAGMLCGPSSGDPEAWLDTVVADAASSTPAPAECRRLVRSTWEETRVGLESDDLDFAPLLPDDEAPLERRAAALGSWCAGFLYGLAVAGLGDAPSLSPEAREAVHDLGELASLDERGGDPRGSEEDYMEVVEYLRVAVMIVHQDVRNAR